MTERKLRRWPLLLIGAPAAVAIWSGWVGLGEMCGFGLVHPLPGILPHAVVNTAITLPVGVEAYATFALGAWLSHSVPATARRFAFWSAIGSLLLGMCGQVAYHLLAAAHASKAPAPVIVAVSCVPVIALGFGAALAHLIRADGDSSEQAPRHELAEFAAPLVTALAARIATPRGSTPGPLASAPAELSGNAPDGAPAEPPAGPPGSAPGTPPADSPGNAPASAPAGPPAGAPDDAPAERPAGPPGDDPDESAGGTSRATAPIAVARVRRKGASASTDDEIRAAIRELLAGNAAITKYAVRSALKGPKGTLGDGRCARLLAEVQAERPSHLSAVK